MMHQSPETVEDSDMDYSNIYMDGARNSEYKSDHVNPSPERSRYHSVSGKAKASPKQEATKSTSMDTSSDAEDNLHRMEAFEIGKDEDSCDSSKSDNRSCCWKIPEILSYYVVNYFRKMSGVEGQAAPPYKPWYHIAISAVLVFIGTVLISMVDSYFLSQDFNGVKILTAAYASSAVIIFESYKSPSAQPRNIVGGYCISTTIGVTVRYTGSYFSMPRIVVASAAVSFAVIGMNLTKTMHPPGGSAALIAVIGGDAILSLGYGYVLTSTGGAFILVSAGIIINNLFITRRYPWYWH